MASLWEVAQPLRQIRFARISRPSQRLCARRWASAQAAAEAPALDEALIDLEPETSMGTPPPTEEQVKKYGTPKSREAMRKFPLPERRYKYHPPKYNKGPLHPIQPPPSSDPVARDFIPGPFNFPRLRETWQTTIAPDLMTMMYLHQPPGTPKKVIGQRLREWDGSSPYHKNRPLRKPRGGNHLWPVEKDINHRNVPELKEITVATYQPKAIKNKESFLSMRAAIMAITGVIPEITPVKVGVSQWYIHEGDKAGCKATVYGHAAYELLDKMVHIVFPKIKDWPGVKASTGDSTGNLSWGFTPDQLLFFPEIEVNYDMYPAKKMPGCRVFVKTTAKSDRHARLLLEALGVPFYGKIIN